MQREVNQLQKLFAVLKTKPEYNQKEFINHAIDFFLWKHLKKKDTIYSLLVNPDLNMQRFMKINIKYPYHCLVFSVFYTNDKLLNVFIKHFKD